MRETCFIKPYQPQPCNFLLIPSLTPIPLFKAFFLPQYKIKWILELTRFNYYSHAYLNKYIESSKTELVLHTVKSNKELLIKDLKLLKHILYISSEILSCFLHKDANKTFVKLKKKG